MVRKVSGPSELALVANGSSSEWDVSLSEFLGHEGWALELDGPQTYLLFRIQDLEVLRTSLRLLQSGSQMKWTSKGPHGATKRDVHLGWFGKAPVTLVWDNEDFARCFLIVGAKARSTLRLSLESKDIQMLTEALQQVVKGLGALPRKRKPTRAKQGIGNV